MNWIILAFGAVFLFTILNLFQRVLASDSENPRAMAVLFNAIASFLAILLFILSGSYKNFTLPTDPGAWIALAIASFCYGMFERSRFRVAKILDASVFTTILNISVLVAFLGSSILYSEPLTIPKLLGGILIIGALVLVSVNGSSKKSSSKGVLIAVIISLILGLGWMLDKLGTQFFNASTYNIFVWTIPIIFIYLPFIKFAEIKNELRISSWKIILLAGLNVIGYFMQLKALEIAEATRVIPIIQTSTLFTVLAGIIILKEKQFIFRKIIAGIMAVTGVYLLI